METGGVVGLLMVVALANSAKQGLSRRRII